MLVGQRDYKSKYQVESPEERIKTKKEFKLIIEGFFGLNWTGFPQRAICR